MDLHSLWDKFGQEALGYIFAALFALLWAFAKRQEPKIMADLRAYADTLQPWQHDAIEQVIVWADKTFAGCTGADKMDQVIGHLEGRGVPINAAYVQAVFNMLNAKGKVNVPKGAA